MLLAPMVGVMDTCVLRSARDPGLQQAALHNSCTGKQGSAAELLEETLAPLAAKDQSATSSWRLGYTLPVPLLQMFKAEGDQWRIDADRVQRVARTVQDSPRPLILYLFSTHFATHAPLEVALSKDPANLAQTRDGALPIDEYYGAPIYPWSMAHTETPITQRREEASRAVLDALCRLPTADRRKVEGITLLGELHHLFPDFQAGMGFTPPYRVTDYSPASRQGFQQYLQRQFGSIAQLNRVLGADYARFEDVQPPARDIRAEPLQRYTEHMDSFAHGVLPVAGWAHVADAPGIPVPWVHIYRNGIFQGKTRVNQGRQDVLQAKPELGNANTGWRLDLDFRLWPTGLHRLDLFLEATPGRLTAIGARDVAIMDRRQSTPVLAPQSPLPAAANAHATWEAHIDLPAQHAALYYNPLASWWHAYRGQQITRYLQHFDALVQGTCFQATPRYTHQIIPFANPSWDAQKFAIADSLRPMGSLRLGVSLYGDASYGPGFQQWLRSSGHVSYGVTEFHPLKAMDRAELQTVLEGHARHGAQFLSFFVEPAWQGERLERTFNPFAFDPHNHEHGSQDLYEAAKGLAH